jgi:hypothetical protein
MGGLRLRALRGRRRLSGTVGVNGYTLDPQAPSQPDGARSTVMKDWCVIVSAMWQMPGNRSAIGAPVQMLSATIRRPGLQASSLAMTRSSTSVRASPRCSEPPT